MKTIIVIIALICSSAVAQAQTVNPYQQWQSNIGYTLYQRGLDQGVHSVAGKIDRWYWVSVKVPKSLSANGEVIMMYTADLDINIAVPQCLVKISYVYSNDTPWGPGFLITDANPVHDTWDYPEGYK